MNHKYLLSAAALLVASSNLSFADVDSAQVRNLENRVSVLEQRRGSSGMINPPGRPQVKNGADLFITGDLLVWQAHEDNLPVAIESTTTTDLSNATIKGFDWNWNAGCRVGVGYNTAHDGWDLGATWLHFNTHAHERKRTDDALWPSQAHPGAASEVGTVVGDTYYQRARAHWAMNLNQIDLDLGREYYVSKWLTLRPHVGLRSAWVRQHANFRYNRSEGTPGIDDHIGASCNFWGIGLESGINTQWGLGSGWSIYGDAGFALLYGFYKTARDEVVSFDTQFGWADVDGSSRITRAIADLALGMRWDSWTDDERVHFRLQAGWEHHIYFSQNQFPHFVNGTAIGDFVANQGDLTLQGWTLSARLDF